LVKRLCEVSENIIDDSAGVVAAGQVVLQIGRAQIAVEEVRLEILWQRVDAVEEVVFLRI